jgi:hypothetical protein
VVLLLLVVVVVVVLVLLLVLVLLVLVLLRMALLRMALLGWVGHQLLHQHSIHVVEGPRERHTRHQRGAFLVPVNVLWNITIIGRGLRERAIENFSSMISTVCSSHSCGLHTCACACARSRPCTHAILHRSRRLPVPKLTIVTECKETPMPNSEVVYSAHLQPAACSEEIEVICE